MEQTNFNHIPVLLNETIKLLNINPDGIYVDATAGGGGHSSEILKKLKTGRLIAIDQDPDAIQNLKNKFKGFKNIDIMQGNFANIKELLENINVFFVDGILMDLGVSSFQLDEKARGFSYHKEAKLDMRMSKKGLSAAEIVNNYSKNQLIYILKEYGEEKFAPIIASNIIKARQTNKITTTTQLGEIIKASYPEKFKRKSHPARKTFQALRIEVNREFEVLKSGLKNGFNLLNKNGRMVVITFHSLEDRIVKKQMKSWEEGCTCPPQFPVCVCGKKPKAKIITKKPITANENELKNNPRSRSAKLRACEKLKLR